MHPALYLSHFTARVGVELSQALIMAQVNGEQYHDVTVLAVSDTILVRK